MSKSNNNAEYVRTVRELLGLSQADFATVLRISERTVRRYETGAGIPWHTLQAIEALEREARERA